MPNATSSSQVHTDAIVVGAGMVGICSAIELQKRGVQTTLLDRRGIAREASYGNAGLFSVGSIVPINTPQVFADLWRYGSNSSNALRIKYSQILALMPWLFAFLSNCRHDNCLRSVDALNVLMQATMPLHQQLMSATKQLHRVNPKGWLRLFKTPKDVANSAFECAMLSRHGFAYDTFNEQQIRDIEPALTERYSGAVRVNDTLAINDPTALAEAYVKHFIDLGGQFIHTEVTACQATTQGWQVFVEDGHLSTSQLVLCAGAQTPNLLDALGYANPMVIERGYHREFAYAADAPRLNHAIYDASNGYVVHAMAHGYRVTSGVELIKRPCTPNYQQIDTASKLAKANIIMGDTLTNTPWVGHRPSFADAIPLIGAAPKHRHLWLGYGHNHVGFTLGPITGQLLATMVTGDKLPFDCTAYAPARYL